MANTCSEAAIYSHSVAVALSNCSFPSFLRAPPPNGCCNEFVMIIAIIVSRVQTTDLKSDRDIFIVNLSVSVKFDDPRVDMVLTVEPRIILKAFFFSSSTILNDTYFDKLFLHLLS